MRRAGIAVGEDEFRGLYTSDEEADRLLRPSIAGSEEPERKAFAAARDAIALVCGNDTGRFGRLVADGGSRFVRSLVAPCSASLPKPTWESNASSATSRTTSPSAGHALTSHCGCSRTKAEDSYGAFDAASRLRRLRLITLHDEPGQPHTPLRARYVGLDPRVVAYLDGHDGIEESLQLHAELLNLTASDADVSVAALAALPATSLAPPVIALQGPDSEAVRAVAGHLAEGSGLRLLAVGFAAASLRPRL